MVSKKKKKLQTPPYAARKENVLLQILEMDVNMLINCLLLVLVHLLPAVFLCSQRDDALPRGFALGTRLPLAFHHFFRAALFQALHQTLGKTLV